MYDTLYIFCEGHTEADVLISFLRPYWKQSFTGCEIVRYSGAGDLKAKYVLDATHIFKTEPRAAILCLIDLYEEPFRVYDRDRMGLETGFSALQSALMHPIPPSERHRFGAFPVVMELETWLLADPVLQKRWQVSYPQPETIYRPSQVLKKILSSGYNKRIDGRRLFGDANAQRVYDDSCPHFRHMIHWLENPLPELPFKRSVAYLERENQFQRLLDEYARVNNELNEDTLAEAIALEARINDFNWAAPA